MQDIAYLDNAATTSLWPEVAAWLQSSWEFGNPSSGHALGRKAKALLDEARSSVAQDLGVEPNWVIFTASATESDNLAILGSARAIARERQETAQRKGKSVVPMHLVCSGYEHPAVAEPMQLLCARENMALEIAEGDEEGRLLARHLLAKVQANTALVSVMAVHNELGLIFPVQEIASALASHPARLHCDGVQAVATLDVQPKAWGLDLLTLTAHKIGGPKGVGVLIKDPKLPLDPLCVGGGQEQAQRPGTENAHMAMAFALALRETTARRDQHKARYLELRDMLLKGLAQHCPQLVVVSERLPCVPNIVTVCVPGQQGAALVKALDERGVCASAGSACHAHDEGHPSAAARLGLDAATASGMLRMSLGPGTDKAQINRAIAAFAEIVA